MLSRVADKTTSMRFSGGTQADLPPNRYWWNSRSNCNKATRYIGCGECRRRLRIAWLRPCETPFRLLTSNVLARVGTLCSRWIRNLAGCRVCIAILDSRLHAHNPARIRWRYLCPFRAVSPMWLSWRGRSPYSPRTSHAFRILRRTRFTDIDDAHLCDAPTILTIASLRE